MRYNLAKIISVTGILAGIVSIILAIVLFCMTDGFFTYSATYGGDAYTGIHEATAQAANNIKHLTSIARMGFGSLLLLIGVITICYFGNQLISAGSTVALKKDNLQKKLLYADDFEKGVKTKPYSDVLERVAQNTGNEPEKWICVCCGSKNAATALYCADCGKSK